MQWEWLAACHTSFDAQICSVDSLRSMSPLMGSDSHWLLYSQRRFDLSQFPPPRCPPDRGTVARLVSGHGGMGWRSHNRFGGCGSVLLFLLVSARLSVVEGAVRREAGGLPLLGLFRLLPLLLLLMMLLDWIAGETLPSGLLWGRWERGFPAPFLFMRTQGCGRLDG